MNVASLELCKTLHELSGWDNTPAGGRERWIELPDGSWELLRLSDVEANGLDKQLWFNGIPAYDLGYLLRKLPKSLKHPATGNVHLLGLSRRLDTEKWDADYERSMLPHATDDTPEDAACKLAIELFKRRILTKA